MIPATLGKTSRSRLTRVLASLPDGARSFDIHDNPKLYVDEIVVGDNTLVSGLLATSREITVCARLRGGAERTRTSNQTIISRDVLETRSTELRAWHAVRVLSAPVIPENYIRTGFTRFSRISA
jgi:hypothetical protein